VFGAGPETARIVFVGEQPGDQEDRRGEPFVGPAGRLLDKALDDAGIDRRDAYITNAVKHFRFTPTPKRRIHQSPGAEHLTACRPWLEAEFAVLQPEVVVCLGAVAAKALISPSFRITRERGQLLPWTPPGRHAVPLAEPDADGDEPEEETPAQTWMLATAHPSALPARQGVSRDDTGAHQLSLATPLAATGRTRRICSRVGGTPPRECAPRGADDPRAGRALHQDRAAHQHSH
jgi:DNA polymerase